ncbi:MAG: ribosome biogenesis GTP-binding protein YihA/YsxC [Alphaproteobacteria bacterium]
MAGHRRAQDQAGADEIEAGRRLFAQECRFAGAAAQPSAIPDFDLPEVAFAGRSNVGKSSLLNALTGRRSLARTSVTPGRTRQLNFFSLGSRLTLVDLPGYGYARASKREIAAWTALTEAYLRGRVALRRVCLLVDARHELKDSDREMMARLDAAAVSFQLVLTKADKTKPDEVASLIARLTDALVRHPAAWPEIAVTSARENRGIAELRAGLARFAR